MNAPDSVATSSVGEKITPPRTRQLSTASRDSGRYHAIPATKRVNCCNEDEPMYLELCVISTVPSEPRVGSIGLFTRGKVPRAVSVASTRFSRSDTTTSVVQALNAAQKLSGVASVRPYDSVYVSDRGMRRRGVVRVSATLAPVSWRR